MVEEKKDPLNVRKSTDRRISESSKEQEDGEGKDPYDTFARKDRDKIIYFNCGLQVVPEVGNDKGQIGEVDNQVDAIMTQGNLF